MKKKKYEIKFELIVLPLFILLAIMSIVYVGFVDFYSSLFTIVTILFLPVYYIGLKIARRLMYALIRGEIEYED